MKFDFLRHAVVAAATLKAIANGLHNLSFKAFMQGYDLNDVFDHGAYEQWLQIPLQALKMQRHKKVSRKVQPVLQATVNSIERKNPSVPEPASSDESTSYSEDEEEYGTSAEDTEDVVKGAVNEQFNRDTILFKGVVDEDIGDIVDPKVDRSGLDCELHRKVERIIKKRSGRTKRSVSTLREANPLRKPTARLLSQACNDVVGVATCERILETYAETDWAMRYRVLEIALHLSRLVRSKKQKQGELAFIDDILFGPWKAQRTAIRKAKDWNRAEGFYSFWGILRGGLDAGQGNFSCKDFGFGSHTTYTIPKSKMHRIKLRLV